MTIIVKPTMQSIMEATSAETGIGPADLYGTGRFAHIVRARHMAWYVANRTFGIGLAAIGRMVGRDHATVRHGALRVARWVPTDAVVAELVYNIELRVRGFEVDRQQRAKAMAGVMEDPCKPVTIYGSVCSPEWWASNDASFRAGVARAAREERLNRLREFSNMGKTTRNLNVAADGGKSPLALPRNLNLGLQRSSHTTQPEHTQR